MARVMYAGEVKPELGVTSKILYSDADGNSTTRVIRPISYYQSKYGVEYLRAYCYLREDERTFRVDRILYYAPAEARAPAAKAAPTGAVIAAAGSPDNRTRSSGTGPGDELAAPAGPVTRGAAPVNRERRTSWPARIIGLTVAAILVYAYVQSEDNRDGGRGARYDARTVQTLTAAYRQAAQGSAATPAAGSTAAGAPSPVDAYRGYTITRPGSGETAGAGRGADGGDGTAGAYAVERLGRKYISLRAAHLAINAHIFTADTSIADERVLALYASADTDGNGNLSWAEIVQFQRRLYDTFRYKNNDTALRPDEFLDQDGGDCEDWAIMTAGLLDFWGWNSQIAVYADPSADEAHAVCFVWSVAPIPGYGYLRVAAPIRLATGTLESGYYIPIDYQDVGSFSTAVGPGWELTGTYRAVSLYDRVM